MSAATIPVYYYCQELIKAWELLSSIFGQGVNPFPSTPPLGDSANTLMCFFTQKARNGSPELPPPPPPSVLLNSFEEDDDPSYTTVKQYKTAANITASPGVKVVRTPDGEIVNYGSRKYQNFLRVETQANTVSNHTMLINALQL